MTVNAFAVPTYTSNTQENERINDNLRKVIRTVGNENEFLRKIPSEDLFQEACLLFAEGTVQQRFSTERAVGNETQRSLEQHFFAYFSRALYNRLVDEYGSRYSNIKTSRIRSTDDPEIAERKVLASLGKEERIDHTPGANDDGGDESQGRNTVHDILASSQEEIPLESRVDRMEMLAEMKENCPIMYNRLMDAARHPAEVKSHDGRHLSYNERLQEVESEVERIAHSRNWTADFVEDAKKTLSESIKGWRSVRGKYNRRSAKNNTPKTVSHQSTQQNGANAASRTTSFDDFFRRARQLGINV